MGSNHLDFPFWTKNSPKFLGLNIQELDACFSTLFPCRRAAEVLLRIDSTLGQTATYAGTDANDIAG
jgi:hypothetical protein